MYDSADIYTSVQLPYVSTKAALANIECCPHVVFYAYYQPSTRIGRDCTRGGILDRSQSTRERASHTGVYTITKTHCATIHLLIVSHMEGVSINSLPQTIKNLFSTFCGACQQGPVFANDAKEYGREKEEIRHAIC